MIQGRAPRRLPILLGLANALNVLNAQNARGEPETEPTAKEPSRAAEAKPADDVHATEAEPEFEGVAEVEAPPREPTKHTVEREQLTTIPGTRGDALRAIEIMPGVARTPFGANPGPPLLRGSPANESLALLDGAPMPYLYHFGGLTSLFNSHLLESVTLYPGNYSARYGRAAGGVVDARVRDPNAERFHALLELSAIDSMALAEGPLGKDTSVAVAARRSNIDFFIDQLITDDSTTVVAAPVYWDYQAILAQRFDESNQLRVVAYGSSDAFELVAGEELAEDPALRGELAARDSFHHLQFELRSRLSDVVQQQVLVAGGRSPGQGRFGSTNYNYEAWDAQVRAEWSIFAAPWLRLDTGLDVQPFSATFRYEGPTLVPAEGTPNPGTVASLETSVVDSEISAVRSAAYVEASIRPTSALLLTPGLRVDHFGDTGAVTVDPRLGARLATGATTTLKAGAGLYSQPPDYVQLQEEFGNPELEPFRTVQTSLGIEQALSERLQANVDGFYKRWQNRPVSTPGGAPPGYVNDGTGDAYGVELLVDWQLSRNSRAFLSYTLSRSTRQDGGSEPTRLFDRDQTHNLSLAGNYDLGRGWLVGVRFRYVTGSPYSEVAGANYDASSDTYRPLYGPLNTARLSAFNQLDVRVEKLWEWGPLDFTVYLEIMNAYAASNEEARRYSFDYRESAAVVGMPFFPNLGVRGEL